MTLVARAKLFGLLRCRFSVGVLAHPSATAYNQAMANTARILEEALALEPEERARVARQLIMSLEAEAPEERTRKHEALRAALEEGEQSGVAEDSSLEGVLADFRARRR